MALLKVNHLTGLGPVDSFFCWRCWCRLGLNAVPLGTSIILRPAGNSPATSRCVLGCRFRHAMTLGGIPTHIYLAFERPPRHGGSPRVFCRRLRIGWRASSIRPDGDYRVQEKR
jgi:hypothetical protein